MLYSAIRDIWIAFREFTDQAIVFAMAAVVFYVAIALIVYIVRVFQKKQAHSLWYVFFKTCLFALFGIYTSYLVALTLSGRDAGSREGVYNIVPFATINISNISLTVFENIVLFMPLGFLIPFVWKYFRGFFRTTVIGFFISMLIEISQLMLKRGYFDVDDIILNTLGAMIGYVLFAGIYDGYLGIKRRVITDVSRQLHIAPPLGRLYDRFVLSTPMCLFVLQFFPVVIWANIIMGFSSDTGDESGMLSKGIVMKLFALFSDRMITEEQMAVLPEGDAFLLIEKIIRKMAHCFIYAVFALLVWALLYSIRKVYRLIPYIFGLVSAFILGMVDEANQAQTVGRTGVFQDVLVDSAGALFALLLVMLAIGIMKKHYFDKFSSSHLS